MSDHSKDTSQFVLQIADETLAIRNLQFELMARKSRLELACRAEAQRRQGSVDTTQTKMVVLAALRARALRNGKEMGSRLCDICEEMGLAFDSTLDRLRYDLQHLRDDGLVRNELGTTTAVGGAEQPAMFWFLV